MLVSFRMQFVWSAAFPDILIQNTVILLLKSDNGMPATSLLGSLYSINWMVLITETACVYCAVRTELISIMLVNFSSLSRGMAQAVSRRPLAPEARIQSQATPCEIFGTHNGSRIGSLMEHFGFPRSVFRRFPIPVLISTLLLVTKKDKETEPENLPKVLLFRESVSRVEKLCHFLYSWNFVVWT
jgi:hypothetical protein